MKISIQPQFKEIIKNTYGQTGIQWLEYLSDSIESCLIHWNLILVSQDFPMSYSFIFSAKNKDGQMYIIKLRPKSQLQEVTALTHLKGKYMVNLEDAFSKENALLLAYVNPGYSLVSILPDEHKATTIAADLMVSTITELSNTEVFDSVDVNVQILEVLKQNSSPFLAEDILYAQNMYRELCSDSTYKLMLLHGDLHHNNIIFDNTIGWIAIDPKGLIGDECYNAARFLHKFWGTGMTMEKIQLRLNILHEKTGWDKGKMLRWAYIDFMTSKAYQILNSKNTVKIHTDFCSIAKQMLINL